MSAYLISQVLIGFAFAFDFASFQFKKREVTLSLFFISAALISTHYFLLGAVTAGFVVALSSLRFFVSIFTTKKYLKYLFIIAVLAVGLSTFDGREDFFAVSGGILATIAAFQTNEKRLRIFMLFATSCFIITNILIKSPAAIFLETFFLLSNIISYYRFFRTRKRIL